MVRLKGDAALQSLDQVGVTGEMTSEQQGIVVSVFQDAPGVLLVPATRGKEGRVAEDLPEARKVDVAQAPATQELVLFFVAEDLFVALKDKLVGPVSKTKERGDSQAQ